MKKRTIKICLILVIALAIPVSGLQAQEISGVFGMAPVTADAAMAVWVPLESGQSVAGVRWFNNDGSQVFPEVLAVAGDPEYPSPLADAVQVGTNVAGATLGWSELTFTQPLASATPGLFLVFRLPADGEFITEGQGCGLGYTLGSGQVRCWITADGDQWNLISPDYQMAVAAVMNTAKSGDVLVLGTGKEGPADTGKMPPMTVPSLQIGPNPFNPRTTITYALPRDTEISLVIYDVRGRKAATVASGPQSAGKHTVAWDGRNDQGLPLPSGVYLARLKAGTLVMTRRMTLVQ